MTTIHQPCLPNGEALPLLLNRETFREYTVRTVQVDREAACQLLEEQLEKQLTTLIGEDGQVEDISFTARVADGRLEVTLTAQCLEEIGEERENPTQ